MKTYDLSELALRNLRESSLRNSLTTIGISYSSVLLGAGGPAERISIHFEGAPSKLCLGGVFVR